MATVCPCPCIDPLRGQTAGETWPITTMYPMQKPPGAIVQESASSAPVYASTGDVIASTAPIATPERLFPICPSLAAAAAGTLVVHKKGGRTALRPVTLHVVPGLQSKH